MIKKINVKKTLQEWYKNINTTKEEIKKIDINDTLSPTISFMVASVNVRFIASLMGKLEEFDTSIKELSESFDNSTAISAIESRERLLIILDKCIEHHVEYMAELKIPLE